MTNSVQSSSQAHVNKKEYELVIEDNIRQMFFLCESLSALRIKLEKLDYVIKKNIIENNLLKGYREKGSENRL